MTRFRPCIDIFSGRVTQIVGGTLKDNSRDGSKDDGASASASASAMTSTTTDKPDKTEDATLRAQDEIHQQHTTNHISDLPSSHFARLYREKGLTGGHVIMLGAGEESRAVAREACAAWPGGMQVGGGINGRNAAEWIAAGAGKVR